MLKPKISRRSLLCAIAASIDDQPSLREVAQRKGIVFGSMLTAQAIAQDTAYAALVARECAMITPGVEAKFGYVQPHKGIFDFSRLDRLVRFGRAANQQIHMHNLLWGIGNPPWLLAELNAGRGFAVVQAHINSVVGRYRGQVAAWDVVNEPLNPAYPCDQSLLTRTPWRNSLGADYIAQAITLAAVADPHAVMMLNDDNLEYVGKIGEEKRAGYLRLIERLRRARVPIGGFGLEIHIKPWLQFAPSHYRQFLRELAGFDLRLMITEFDVCDRDFAADTQTRDAQVAAIAQTYLEVALDEPALDSVIVWGLSDRWSSMRQERNLRRSDGKDPRGCLYDADLRAKPLRAVFEHAFKHAPARKSRNL